MLSPAAAVAHRKVIETGVGWLSGMSEPVGILATKPWHNDCVALGAMGNETRQRRGFAETAACQFEAFADLRNRGVPNCGVRTVRFRRMILVAQRYSIAPLESGEVERWRRSR